MAFGLTIIDGSGVATSIPDRLTRYITYYNFSVPAGVFSTDLSVPGVEPSTWLALASNNSIAAVFANMITIYRPMWGVNTVWSGIVRVFRY